MAYNEDFYKEYLEKVREFAQIDWVKEYFEAQKKPNFWSILEYGEYGGNGYKKSSYEIRMSKMFRWLLDPNENHNLGNIFAYELIELVKQKRDKDLGHIKYELKTGEAREDYKRVVVTNEEQDIDVLYKDPLQKLYLAMEVKQYSKEGYDKNKLSQLVKYERIVKELISKKDPEIQEVLIFLTPLGEEPSDQAKDKWIAIGYGEFIEIIDQVAQNQLEKSKDKYIEDTKKLILDFRDDLQRVVTISNRQDEYIEKEFNDNNENKEFTFALEKELVYRDNTGYMEKLEEVDQGQTPHLMDLILLIREYMTSQNKRPNLGVRKLTRRLYNYLSDSEGLDYNLDIRYTDGERRSAIKKEFIKKYDLDLKEIYLTRDKGQGIHLYHKDNRHSIYLSGDTYGFFPNDGIHIAKVDKESKIDSNRRIKNFFHIREDLLEEGKVMAGGKVSTKDKKIEYINGEEIGFEEFFQIIMKEIKELNDIINNYNKEELGSKRQ